MAEHMDAGVALLHRRGIVVHKRIEGTQAQTGEVISLTGRREFEYDTACGSRVRSTLATVKPINITCPDCRTAMGLVPRQAVQTIKVGQVVSFVPRGAQQMVTVKVTGEHDGEAITGYRLRADDWNVVIGTGQDRRFPIRKHALVEVP